MNKKYEVEVRSSGLELWRLNGKLHCEHGPAVRDVRGDVWYYFEGLLHRIDGPAYIPTKGESEYYFKGELVTKSEHSLLTSKPERVKLADLIKELGRNIEIVD